MNDNYFNKMVEVYFPVFITDLSESEIRRYLMMFAKEVERDTRHKAAEMAQELSNNIHNMVH